MVTNVYVNNTHLNIRIIEQTKLLGVNRNKPYIYHMCIKFHGLLFVVLIGKKICGAIIFVVMVAW